MKRLIVMLIRKLVNFIDKIEIPEFETDNDQNQQAVNKAWQIAIKPQARKRYDCERNRVVW